MDGPRLSPSIRQKKEPPCESPNYISIMRARNRGTGEDLELSALPVSRSGRVDAGALAAGSGGPGTRIRSPVRIERGAFLLEDLADTLPQDLQDSRLRRVSSGGPRRGSP